MTRINGICHLVLQLVLLQLIGVAAADPLLLIVGSVEPTSARVLYDLPPNAGAQTTALHVRVFVSTTPAPGTRGESSHTTIAYELQHELRVDVSTKEKQRGAPGVVALRDLTPNRAYSVGLAIVRDTVVSETNDNEEFVTFRTPLSPTSLTDDTRSASDRVLVVSCDRFVDDGDDTLWLALVADIDAHDASYFGTAHIGDQVYVDAGSARIAIEPVARSLTPVQLRRRFDTVVNQFRALYRQTFGRPIVQQALRTGAHWMVPDDHEVINNVNLERMQHAFATDADDTDDQEDEALRRGLALHIRAGLQVYYEFQYQLQQDISFADFDFLEAPLATIVSQLPLYFAVDIAGLQLLFLDVRFDRSFFTKSSDMSQLVGTQQLAFIDAHLATPRSTVVVSSVPLFFHSAFTAAVAYAVERETYPGLNTQQPGLVALFHRFIEHARATDSRANGATLELLVGGDVHCLVHTRVCEREGQDDRLSPRCIDQLITSGVTRGSTAVADVKLVPFYWLVTRMAPLVERLLAWTGVRAAALPPWRIAFDRLYLGRNYGAIERWPNGTFEWRASVVVPHETALQDAIQFAVDLSLAHVAGALAALAAIAVAHVVLVRRR